MSLPSWKLPPGVSRGTWDYLNSSNIASNYDAYFVDSQLMRLDLEFVAERLPKTSAQRPLIADLGCGTGRVSRAFGSQGYRFLNVDLSQSMLQELERQCEHPDLNEFLKANLVELDQHLSPGSIDLAVCLFSSIGMVRGRKNRRRFLKALPTALNSRGQLIVHVHNRYHSLWDPKGPSWLASTFWKSRWSKDWEFGDRVYKYRGLPAMFLHIYSRRELLGDLRFAGFKNIKIYPIDLTGSQLISDQPYVGLKAGGYFAVAS